MKKLIDINVGDCVLACVWNDDRFENIKTVVITVGSAAANIHWVYGNYYGNTGIRVVRVILPRLNKQPVDYDKGYIISKICPRAIPKCLYKKHKSIIDLRVRYN